MKVYKIKTKTKFYLGIFITAQIIVNTLLIYVAVHSLYFLGVNSRSVFLSIFALIIFILSFWFVNFVNRVMNVSYSLNDNSLFIHRWRTKSQLQADEILELKLEDHRISFKDLNGRKHIIPSDFENYSELYDDLVKILSIR